MPPGCDRTPEWLTARQRGIGASDVAGVLGLSPFLSPLRVYLDKLGRLPPREMTESMEWGIRHEPTIAQKFADETGFDLVKTGTWQSKTWPWLLANPDRAIRGQSAGLECKTADLRDLAHWENGPPLHYVVQCAACMAVTGAQRWYLAGLIGGNRWFVYEIQRDEDDIAEIVEGTRRFWDTHILADRPPAAQQPASRDEERLLAVLNPDPDGQVVQIPPELQDAVVEHKRLTTERGELDKQTAALAAQIKEFLGPKTFGYIGTRKAVSWPARTDGVRVFNNHWKEQN